MLSIFSAQVQILSNSDWLRNQFFLPPSWKEEKVEKSNQVNAKIW